MNGNLKFVDNGKRQNGKHKEFIMLQNSAYDLLEDDVAALSIYVFLQRFAGSNFNVTIANIVKRTKRSTNTVIRVLKKLETLGLLKREYDRDLTGKSQIKKHNGIKVPNNTVHYTLYALPAASAITVQQNTIIVGMDFTVEDFESGSDIPSDMEEYEEEPIQIVPIRPTAVEVNAEKKQEYDNLAEEKRRKNILQIAANHTVFNRQAEELIGWDNYFYKETGKKLTDGELDTIAGLSSNPEEKKKIPAIINDLIKR